MGSENGEPRASEDALSGAVKEAAEKMPIERVLSALAERIGAVANVQTVFGEPVTREAITVIPVARIFGGFGGGGGPTTHGNVELKGGVGAGAGFTAIPAGFIEIKNGHASFRRLDENWLSSALPASVLGGLVTQIAQALWRRVRR